VRRFAGPSVAYAVTVGLFAAASILSVLSLIAALGAAVWTSVAVAQAAGSLVAVVVAFGWGVRGPAQIAALPQAERIRYYLDSFACRLYMLSAALPLYLVALVCLDLTDNGIGVGLAGATPLAIALGGSWYFVGEMRPGRLLALDTLPRVAGIGMGIGLVTLTQELTLFAAAQLSGAVAAAVLALVKIRGRANVAIDWAPATAIVQLRRSTSAFVTAAAAALYINLPLLILSALHPLGAGAYALADKLRGYTQMAQLPFAQFAQGYVPSGAGVGELWRRIRATLWWATGVGGLLAIAFGVLLPPIGRALSDGDIEIPYTLAVPLAGALWCVVITGVTGPAHLISLERAGVVAVSTLSGAVTGVGLSFILGMPFGAPGVAMAVLLAEMTVASIQLRALRLGWAAHRLTVALAAPQ
jgi:hypothetical protein